MIAETKSERNLIADRLAHFIIVNKLNRPFGGNVSLYRGGKVPCYTVAFSTPRVLDGTVAVYSPHFIQVRYQTGYRQMRAANSIVFRSEEAAITFLRLAFVELNFDAATDFAHAHEIVKA